MFLTFRSNKNSDHVIRFFDFSKKVLKIQSPVKPRMFFGYRSLNVLIWCVLLKKRMQDIEVLQKLSVLKLVCNSLDGLLHLLCIDLIKYLVTVY